VFKGLTGKVFRNKDLAVAKSPYFQRAVPNWHWGGSKERQCTEYTLHAHFGAYYRSGDIIAPIAGTVCDRGHRCR